MTLVELARFISHDRLWILGCLAVAAAIYLCFRARTPVGKPMRKTPSAGVPIGERSFIETLAANGEPVHSCSFIEFDGRGDYLDFDQHRHAWEKVKELASRQPLVLVFYCHGWKNNSQSYDVVKFNDFLGRLAASEAVTKPNYRVHGVYLGWRGNLYHPYVDKSDKSARSAYARSSLASPSSALAGGVVSNGPSNFRRTLATTAACAPPRTTFPVFQWLAAYISAPAY